MSDVLTAVLEDVNAMLQDTSDPRLLRIKANVMVAMADDFASEPTCYLCDGGFTADEWADRHSGPLGEDIHADCCENGGPCAHLSVRGDGSQNRSERGS